MIIVSQFALHLIQVLMQHAVSRDFAVAEKYLLYIRFNLLSSICENVNSILSSIKDTW